ncbi:RICIN domain-containing protein [Brevibacterium sp. JNUCC-42]|nr:RICIN domain-containing protein [Brevibacterium sp. JNUCC-42]
MKTFLSKQKVIWLTVFVIFAGVLSLGLSTHSVQAANDSLGLDGKRVSIATAIDTNKVIDIADRGKPSERPIIYPYHGRSNQIFTLQYDSQYNGYYIIQNGRYLRAVTGSLDLELSNTYRFLWRIELVDRVNGYYTIKVQSNLDYALDVKNSNVGSDTKVQVFSVNNTDAQKWKITPLIDDGYYRIKSGFDPNKAITLLNNSPAKIDISTIQSGSTQTWGIFYDPNKGGYTIKSMPFPLISLVWGQNDPNRWYWIIEKTSDGYFKLRNFEDRNKVLAITTDGNHFVDPMLDDRDTIFQKWILERIK